MTERAHELRLHAERSLRESERIERRTERKLRRLVERTLLIEADPLARADLEAHAARVLGPRRRPVARHALPLTSDEPAEGVAGGEASERAPPRKKDALSVPAERRALIRVFASLQPTFATLSVQERKYALLREGAKLQDAMSAMEPADVAVAARLAITRFRSVDGMHRRSIRSASKRLVGHFCKIAEAAEAVVQARTAVGEAFASEDVEEWAKWETSKFAQGRAKGRLAALLCEMP